MSAAQSCRRGDRRHMICKHWGGLADQCGGCGGERAEDGSASYWRRRRSDGTRDATARWHPPVNPFHAGDSFAAMQEKGSLVLLSGRSDPKESGR
jgi:hypothetical protein